LKPCALPKRERQSPPFAWTPEQSPRQLPQPRHRNSLELDLRGYQHVKIFLSGGIDETKICG
jgi:nicotinic acid phosphoribosyltransferase